MLLVCIAIAGFLLLAGVRNIRLIGNLLKLLIAVGLVAAIADFLF